MTVALTQNALGKLAKCFGENSPTYNAIIAMAGKSPFLASELNAFGDAGDWKFQMGREGRA